MSKNLKRISLMIREDQHQKMADLGLNASGLFRDLLDDYLSEHKITLGVTKETKELYDLIISNTASSDSELELFLKDSLKKLLKEKIDYMIELHKQI